MPEEFTCEACGGTFPKEWSDEEAMVESVAMWGEIPEGEQATVCDDCFNLMLGGRSA